MIRVTLDDAKGQTIQRHVDRTWIQSLVAAGRQHQAVTVLAAARQADPDSSL
jgi:hypothetical protein